MCGGFKIGGTGRMAIKNGAAFGHGLYTAIGPKTPAMYSASSGCCAVILARALKGTVGKEVCAGDSWTVGKHWWVFRNSNQLLPQYVVHYKLKQTPTTS
ncbi:hypothetical protein JKP88DRAFT_229574 [Tribonema minus]|uniref:PARP n=1 Tax=Tribonema minus TaxID=303371 RepID=A0A835YPS2_9STRA|nr:hypothetical protein JKP88DRAFT_229574 [Tribonema minus]